MENPGYVNPLPGPAVIRIRGLEKTFNNHKTGPVVALRGVDLEIREGEFFCVVGPSGCGKTTLLRILAGLERQTAGQVEIAVNEPGRPVNSMVFQEQSVFPWLTVKQNVAYGLRMRGVPRETQDAIVGHYLKLTGLEAFRDAYPHQLSGGMKQRVSVARAFANDPSILLLDEPFGMLDEQTRLILQEELVRIWEASRKTAVFVTHSIDEAIALGDRVLVMTARPGRVKALLEVNLPRPRDLAEVRSHPRFRELFTIIWHYLREEVLERRASQGSSAG